MEIDRVSNTPAVKLPDVEIIDVEVEVDDEAKTSALGALSASAAASLLAANDAPRDANGTQEIDVGDVLEVMQKPAAAAPAPARSAPRPRTSPPPSEQLVSAIVVPPPPSAPQMVLPSVMVARATPVPDFNANAPSNATMELVPGDVLEEIVLDEPKVAHVTAIPAPAPSASDIAKTHVLPQTPRPQLAQFPISENPIPRFSVDEEVAPFASDTVDIPINGIAGMPVWLQIKDKPQLMVVGGAVAACVAIGALALGIHFHDSAASTTSTRTSIANAAIGPTMHREDPAAAIPPPPAQPDVATVSIDDLKKEHAAAAPVLEPSHVSAPAHASPPHAHASHHSEAAAPKPRPQTNGSKPQGFGLVRTWIAARGEPIAVDGKVLGTAPSPVRVACGPHTIAIGREVVKADVPCDGAVTVGSPDHKK